MLPIRIWCLCYTYENISPEFELAAFKGTALRSQNVETSCYWHLTWLTWHVTSNDTFTCWFECVSQSASECRLARLSVTIGSRDSRGTDPTDEAPLAAEIRDHREHGVRKRAAILMEMVSCKFWPLIWKQECLSKAMMSKNIMKQRVNILNHFLKTSNFASFNMAPYGV